MNHRRRGKEEIREEERHQEDPKERGRGREAKGEEEEQEARQRQRRGCNKQLSQQSAPCVVSCVSLPLVVPFDLPNIDPLFSFAQKVH